MKQYRKLCSDETYSHNFLAFVDENMNVEQVCSICNVKYSYSSEDVNNNINVRKIKD
jgi:hypothetical protein